MNIEFKSYPKCKCGNDLVPLYSRTKFKKEGESRIDPEETEILIWHCPKCNISISI